MQKSGNIGSNSAYRDLIKKYNDVIKKKYYKGQCKIVILILIILLKNYFYVIV